MNISATEAWVLDLDTVMNDGDPVSPRGRNTLEVVGYKALTVDMTRPVIVVPERKLGYKFLAAEAAWILSGDDKVATIAPYSKDISKFSDDGHKFAGAYGPKVVDQLEYVVDCLVKDPDSRQAVLNIWRENPGPSKDIPCTLSLQFLYREDIVHCVASMRSSDLWLGHVYDVFNFSMIAAYVAIKLRTCTGRVVGLGDLHLTAGSKHVYEENFDAARLVLKTTDQNGTDDGPTVDVYKFSTADDLVSHLWQLAETGEAKEQSSWDA